MRFLRTAADTDGALLQIETVNPPSGVAEPTHVHPHQETRAEVVSGTLRFVVDGKKRRLGPGEAITIPAGVPHHFVNDGDTDAIAIQEARPALRTAEFFETYFALADRDDHGKPSLLRFAVLGVRRRDPTHQRWPLQRLAFALVGPIARLRGYTAV
jgi:quercetin dioxygenase-like cupin family protein